MKNPALPYLLKAMINASMYEKHKPIFEQAAIELEKLNKIYDEADKRFPSMGVVESILKQKDPT